MTTMSDEVAAIVLLRSDGAALLQHRDEKPGLSHAGLWTPPGGHREPDESILACARREFEEETAYRLGELHMLTEFVDDHVDDSPPLKLTVFWAIYDDVQQVECREGQALEFVRREDASDHPMPQYLVDLWDRAIRAGTLAGRLVCVRGGRA